MPEDQAVTAPAETQDKPDRIEVETNIPSPEESEVKDKASKPKPEPSKEPQADKPVNPRTQQRKAEKERLIREAATTAAENKQLKEQLEKQAPKQPNQPETYSDYSKEPDITKYTDVLKYNRDMAKFEAFNMFEGEKKKVSEANQAKRVESYQDQLKAEPPEALEKIQQVINSGLVDDRIENAVLSSDMSGKIASHLAQFPDKLIFLRGLPDNQMPAAIQFLENFIKQGAKSEPEEKPRITQAGPPIKPPGGTAKTDRSINSFTQEEIENMPISEFKRITNKN